METLSSLGLLKKTQRRKATLPKNTRYARRSLRSPCSSWWPIPLQGLLRVGGPSPSRASFELVAHPPPGPPSSWWLIPLQGLLRVGGPSPSRASFELVAHPPPGPPSSWWPIPLQGLLRVGGPSPSRASFELVAHSPFQGLLRVGGPFPLPGSSAWTGGNWLNPCAEFPRGHASSLRSCVATAPPKSLRGPLALRLRLHHFSDIGGQ